jgi:hypothetical protein
MYVCAPWYTFVYEYLSTSVVHVQVLEYTCTGTMVLEYFGAFQFVPLRYSSTLSTRV